MFYYYYLFNGRTCTLKFIEQGHEVLVKLLAGPLLLLLVLTIYGKDVLVQCSVGGPAGVTLEALLTRHRLCSLNSLTAKIYITLSLASGSFVPVVAKLVHTPH